MTPALPATSTLIKATGIALAVALVILFTAVLPAEYGFDPLKTGAALGLTGISQAQVSEVKGAAPTPAPGQTGVYRPESKIYKVDSEDFTLRPGEGMEMKYHMQTNWTTRLARMRPMAPLRRPQPAFTAGSGRTRAIKKSSSI
jgi:hypothetical protein